MIVHTNLIESVSLLEKNLKNIKEKLKENTPGDLFSEEEKTLLTIALRNEMLKLIDDFVKSFLEPDIEDCEDILDWIVSYFDFLKS